MSDEKDFLESIHTFLVLLVLFTIIFEVLMLASFYFGADEVECTFLWCTFTTTNEDVYVEMTTHQNCYVNNIPVNCSKIPTYEDFVQMQSEVQP